MNFSLIERTKIGSGHVLDPIDPEYLAVSGQIRVDTSLAAAPMPVGKGSQIYRIYCNRGRWEWNGQMGLLRLSAVPGPETGEEEVRFLQVTRDGGSQERGDFLPNKLAFRLEGRMLCRGDMPIRGKITSALYDYTGKANGSLVDGTELCESVYLSGGNLEISIDGYSHRRALKASTWMTEWNLLRMVGRLPFNTDPQLAFCLLEGFTLPKPDARLVSTGTHEAPKFGGLLHSFSLLGRGIVPFDYWLDTEHRLVTCVSGGLGTAYIPERLMIPPVMNFLAAEFDRERIA